MRRRRRKGLGEGDFTTIFRYSTCEPRWPNVRVSRMNRRRRPQCKRVDCVLPNAIGMSRSWGDRPENLAGASGWSGRVPRATETTSRTTAISTDQPQLCITPGRGWAKRSGGSPGENRMRPGPRRDSQGTERFRIENPSRQGRQIVAFTPETAFAEASDRCAAPVGATGATRPENCATSKDASQRVSSTRTAIGIAEHTRLRFVLVRGRARLPLPSAS